MNAVAADGVGGTLVEPQSSERSELWERPLTTRTWNPHQDRSMRLDERFVNDGRPVDHVTRGVYKLREYVRDKADTELVFENGTQPTSHRFSDHYSRRKYGQAMDAARVLEDEWDGVWTIMLTLTAYEYNANDEGRAYVDHLHDLLASNTSVVGSLSDRLSRDGIEFGRLGCIQPHDTGHAHIQHGLFCRECPSAKDLRAAIDLHLKHCDVARESDHGDGAITVKRNPTGLVKELGKDLVGWDDSIGSDNDDTRQKYERLGATLMAANVNQWRPDQGTFQNAIRRAKDEYDHDDLGEQKGVRFEEDGEVYDLGGGGGGITMVDVTDVDANDDPLPNVD